MPFFRVPSPPKDNVRVWYLLDTEFFRGIDRRELQREVDRLARLTTVCISQWATRYEAWPVGFDTLGREGSLPENQDARERLIHDLFDWRLHVPLPQGYPPLLGLRLFHGDELILDQHDGFPLELRLKLLPGEFVVLADWLDHQRFPPDLYFPEHRLRQVVEPMDIHGNVILTTVMYSPRAWRQRDHAPRLEVPTEAARGRDFLDACSAILPIISTRLTTVGEQSGTSGVDEKTELLRFLEELRRVQTPDVVGEDQAHDDHHGKMMISAVPMTDTHPMTQPTSKQYFDAIYQFVKAVVRRGLELHEPGKKFDSAEAKELDKLSEVTMPVMIRAQQLAKISQRDQRSDSLPE